MAHQSEYGAIIAVVSYVHLTAHLTLASLYSRVILGIRRLIAFDHDLQRSRSAGKGKIGSIALYHAQILRAANVTSRSLNQVRAMVSDYKGEERTRATNHTTKRKC
jgi:hypothetical protein